MPARSIDPITKITINLFTSDVIKLKRDLGHGWSGWVRDLIHEKLRLPQAPIGVETYTLEDLDD